MNRFIWFAIFNSIGIFCIGYTFPDMDIKQLTALVIGIECIAISLDFLNDFNKED